MLSWKKGS